MPRLTEGTQEEAEGPPMRASGSLASCEPRPTPPAASTVESLIELYAERWNTIGSQADADRLQAEIEHAATTLAPEELLAYAAAPHLRGRLLALCVFARAQERAAAPRGSLADGAPVRVERAGSLGPVEVARS
jgi:hypothetical protein